MNLLKLIVNNLDISVIAFCIMYFIHEAFKFASVIVISKSDNLTDKKAQAIAKIMSFGFDFKIKKISEFCHFHFNFFFISIQELFEDIDSSEFLYLFSNRRMVVLCLLPCQYKWVTHRVVYHNFLFTLEHAFKAQQNKAFVYSGGRVLLSALP